jgi:hypothetical protein
MKHFGTPLIFLLTGMFLLSSQSFASGDPEQTQSYRIVTLFPGGDVLRPDRSGPSEFKWYLGIDAGPTYSSFSKGPFGILIPNAYTNLIVYQGFSQLLLPPINSGNGIGFDVGGTIDLGFTPHFGLVGKISYHTRSGTFDQTTSSDETDYFTQVPYVLTLNNHVDWTLNFLSFDLLARIQFQPESWYFLIGPSFSSLSSNKLKWTNTIVNPSDKYYIEVPSATNPSPNVDHQIRGLSFDGEVTSLNKTRTDIKGGFGTWIHLSKTLSFTPELTIAYPLTKLQSNTTYNMFTIFFTVGLRWKMN